MSFFHSAGHGRLESASEQWSGGKGSRNNWECRCSIFSCDHLHGIDENFLVSMQVEEQDIAVLRSWCTYCLIRGDHGYAVLSAFRLSYIGFCLRSAICTCSVLGIDQ